jgi:gamma-glutamylputrescine oxidase
VSVDYPDTYYARTANLAPPRPPLEGEIETEVCIIGGGLAGLNTALSLGERGVKSVVLEARKVSWGASGRNGGFVGPGFSEDMDAIARRLGLDRARRLRDLTRQAVDLVKHRIESYQIACSPVYSGTLRAWWTDKPGEAERKCAALREQYDVAVEYWPREKLRGVIRTTRYHDGLCFPGNFSFHPLNYAIGVAAAAEARGARVYEGSPATGFDLDRPEKVVRTARGRVKARSVVFTCGGYIDGLHPKLSRAIRPLATWIMVTKPLGDRLRDAITAPLSVSDSRYVFDYWRPLPDTRLLWGGGYTILRNDPASLSRIMMDKLLTVFPQLKGVRAETSWSGLMGYPRHRMPQFGEVAPGVWYGMGFGGHGMGTTTMAGELLAGAIAEGDDRYRLFNAYGLDWTGGPAGLVAVEAIIRWNILKDWLRS